MKIRARPCARCSSRSRFRYCAWIVRSRLVVGSSAISSRGSQEMPMAPTMRWRMPPDISCGMLAQPRLRRGDAHRLQQVAAPGSRRAPRPRALVHPDRLRHLVADREQRVQRGHRVLQDHGDALAAHAAHLGVGFLQQVLALEHHPCRWRCAPPAAAGAGWSAPACSCPSPTRRRCPGSRRASMRRLTLFDRAHHARALRRDVVGREVLELEQRASCPSSTDRCHRRSLRADGAGGRA